MPVFLIQFTFFTVYKFVKTAVCYQIKQGFWNISAFSNANLNSLSICSFGSFSRIKIDCPSSHMLTTTSHLTGLDRSALPRPSPVAARRVGPASISGHPQHCCCFAQTWHPTGNKSSMWFIKTCVNIIRHSLIPRPAIAQTYDVLLAWRAAQRERILRALLQALRLPCWRVVHGHGDARI